MSSSILYDFIINKEGDIFGNNLLVNAEAEGISPAVGTINPWVASSVTTACVFGAVSIYGDFAFRILGVPVGDPVDYMYQIITDNIHASESIQIFGFFYTNSKLGITQPTAHMRVSVLYNEDSVRDLFFLPINAAMTSEYAGNISVIGDVNFYLAKSEFKLRTDKTVASIVVTVSNQDTVNLHCDNIAIRLSTNTPVSRSVYNAEPMIDKYGVDSRFLDNYKNMVWNSGFEIFDPATLEPTHWTGGVVDENTNFSGSRSVKLETTDTIIQSGSGVINPNWFGGGIARVSFFCRK